MVQNYKNNRDYPNYSMMYYEISGLDNYYVKNTGNFSQKEVSLLFNSPIEMQMRNINKILVALIIGGSSVAWAWGEVSFQGNTLPVFVENPVASTGLNNIYVINSTQGVSAIFASSSGNTRVKWYKYGQPGGGYAEEITDIVYEGSISRLNNVIPNSGYIIEDGTNREYFWIVNYADYYLDLGEISFSAEADCEVMNINVAGFGPEISYYTINGQHKTLSRELELKYSTLEWDVENKTYKNAEKILTLENFKNTIAVPVPFCNTPFTLSGDRFLAYWNKKASQESDLYTTQAVEVQGLATQKGGKEGVLGGSAPAEIEFAGYLTDAVTHKEWQIASDAEFEKILSRFNDDTINYTFLDAGTFFVRFVGTNSSNSCQSTSETFTVNIGESKLTCPNAFSPQSSEGINDVWKVSYKSIVSFQCNIFNRWGIEMCSISNPADGWDGKYKGKYVDSGVYFYVIIAKGADGVDYKLKGDINIINKKK